MASKNSKPRLDELVVAKFCKGSSCWFYKRSHNSDTFQEHDFLLEKLLGPIMKGNLEISKKTARGINSTKKKHILDKLGPLMPLSRRKIFSDLEDNQRILLTFAIHFKQFILNTLYFDSCSISGKFRLPFWDQL